MALTFGPEYFDSWIVLQLMVLAKGRVVLALEGGYNLNSISNSYLACMQALLGDPSPETPCGRAPLPESLPLIEKVLQNKLYRYCNLNNKEYFQ